MKYLGIDYGGKRIGIAVSDEGGKIAFPRETILNEGKKGVIREIKKIVRDNSVGHIVVGLPIGRDGKETNQTKATKEFKDFLTTEISLPVSEQNELLTSRIAEMNSSKETADASAAALILQAFLDKPH